MATNAFKISLRESITEYGYYKTCCYLQALYDGCQNKDKEEMIEIGFKIVRHHMYDNGRKELCTREWAHLR